MRRSWFAGLTVLFAACGEADRPPPAPPGGGHGGGTTIGTTGGTAGTAGTAGNTSGGKGGSSGDAGARNDAGSNGDAGAGGADGLAPTVEIISPEAVVDPDQGEVLIEDQVIVLCKATRADEPGSLPPTNVIIALDDGSNVDEETGVRTNNDDEYRATFPLATRESGAVRFRCKATDAANRSAEDEISTFIDRGPTIEPILPQPEAFRALAGKVLFEFSVEPTLLAPRDVGAEVVDVALAVEGIPIDDLAPARNRPGVYSASVDFSDKVRFPQTPTGNIAVTIEATNSREPTAAVGVLNYSFTLDADVPDVTITAPARDRVLPGSLQVTFTATDSVSGIDLGRVFVVVNGETFQYDEKDPTTWKHSGNSFTFDMDRSKIENKSQAIILVSATDKVGNGPATDTRVVHLDAVPPFISLDVPNIRVVAPQASGEVLCSSSFDPLGEKAVNDLTLITYDGVVRPYARFRVFMSDRTTMDGQSEQFYAGVVDGSGSLHVQPASDPALLIDEDGDDMCDAISPEAEANLAGTLSLEPLRVDGEYIFDPEDFTTAPDASGESCVLRATNNRPLCANQVSDIEVVVRQQYVNQANNLTAMWAVNVSDPGITCTGSQIDLTSLVGTGYEGWVCVAATAKDHVGNVGVSAPLRLCLDNGTGPASPCSSLANPPSCTDSCKAPSRGWEGDDSSGKPVPFLWNYMAP